MPRKSEYAKPKKSDAKKTATKKSVAAKTAPVDSDAALSASATSTRLWSNQHIAALLDRIRDILAIQGENRFKIIAYQRASDVIEHSSRGVQDVWQGDTANL